MCIHCAALSLLMDRNVPIPVFLRSAARPFNTKPVPGCMIRSIVASRGLSGWSICLSGEMVVLQSFLAVAER